MLDIELLRSNPEAVKHAIRAKGMGDPDLVDQIGALDSQWRRGSTELQALKTALNERGKKIGLLMRDGAREEAQALVAENSQLKEQASDIESSLKELADRRGRMLLEMPNIPHESVPPGSTADDNVEVGRWGELSTFDFSPRPHWELLESLKLADFSRGAKVTGAGPSADSSESASSSSSSPTSAAGSGPSSSPTNDANCSFNAVRLAMSAPVMS